MYSSRLAPIHRIRRQERANPTQPSVSGSKDKACLDAASTSTPRMSGDYSVLKESVEKHRESVFEARASLASGLDRLGEHHVRQKEYDDAMDAFTEALHEKRSIFSVGRIGNELHVSGIESATSTNDRKGYCIDEIIFTLRNMGNVHSLRGEQDEAMRYYTEVTNLRASKVSARSDTNDDMTTLISGLGGGEEDNSTLMSEINEDVKALDDMFRSISFRQDSFISATRVRKSKPLAPSLENASPSSKRRKSDTVNGSFISLESEPFRRSSSPGVPASGNEVTEALDAYKTVLQIYKGPNLEQHKETFNSFALRVDLLSDDIQRADSPSQTADLELTLEIYAQVLAAQKEICMPSPESDSNPQLSANMASTLIRMGSLHYKLGNRANELSMYTEAKDTYSKAFGEKHLFVAGARKNIGMVLAESGEYDQAMEQFDDAKKIYIELQQDQSASRDVASAISCMGNVKNRIGELDAALERYEEALAMYKAVQADSIEQEAKSIATNDVTATLKVIGMVHAKKGEPESAMVYFSEALALLQTSGAESTPIGRETKASVLTRMASILVKNGDLEKAMSHYREAYELTVRSRGTTNHPDVAGILHYIGGTLHKRGEFDEAMDCYQEAIRVYHSTLGPGNPTVAGTLVMVGSIHYKRRNLDSAMMFYREALRLNRDAYGLHHPDIAPILKSIGTILTKKGEYKEAYGIFRDVLSIKCAIYGTGNPEVAGAYKSLGNVHYKLGELADAERQYRHALNIYRRARGEEHPDTMAARTTIEHIRYWMKERGQRQVDERHTRSSGRPDGEGDERSC